MKRLRRILTSLPGVIDILEEDVKPRTKLDKFDLDLLGRIELTNQIGEEFGAWFGPADIEDFHTCGDLLRAIQHNQKNLQPTTA